ncbi:hypothetical protein BKA70DRAFT_1056271, partial [Coprinopsis sp. MPI-PUGE-AT-0042]
VPGLERIWYFSSDKCKQLINVMITNTLSPLPAIACFHSTVVMSFIAYYGVVSLYPDLVRRQTGWINRADPATRRDVPWIDKYNQRGYHILGDSRLMEKHECRTSPSCTQTIRNLFDQGVTVAKFREYRYIGDMTLLKSTERVFIWK